MNVTTDLKEPRKATIADAPAIAKLADAAYEQWIPVIGAVPLPMEVDYEEMAATSEFWITGPSASPTSSLVLKYEPDHLVLWSIAISPEATGQGLGNTLMDFVETRARAANLDEIRLFTNIKMQRNRDWYSRRGYVEQETKQVGDKITVFMSLKLD